MQLTTVTQMTSLEVAEISPRYDYDDRTSRLIANLIYQVILKHFDCEIN